MNPHLRPFDPTLAATVVSWVPTDQDLLWLAPRTDPPLTPQKVLDWRGERNTMYLLYGDDSSAPCGYGEVNRIKSSSEQLWLGHIIVDPEVRGRGIGLRFVNLLLGQAFGVPDIQSVSLVVFPDNLSAVGCYLKAGFNCTRVEYHRFRPNRKRRMLRMDVLRGDWLKSRAADLARPTAGRSASSSEDARSRDRRGQPL